LLQHKAMGSASRGRRPEGGEAASAVWGGCTSELRRVRRRKAGVEETLSEWFGEGRSSERMIWRRWELDPLLLPRRTSLSTILCWSSTSIVSSHCSRRPTSRMVLVASCGGGLSRWPQWLLGITQTWHYVWLGLVGAWWAKEQWLKWPTNVSNRLAFLFTLPFLFSLAHYW
jgi:hypothetical protein